MLQQQELQELQVWFRTVDRDGSGHISARELQMLTFGGVPLGLDTAIKLVKVFDKDRSGSIGFFFFFFSFIFIYLFCVIYFVLLFCYIIIFYYFYLLFSF